MRIALALCLSLLASACNNDPAPNCSDQPTLDGSALVTQAECSFVQHTDNILHNGEALTTRPLVDVQGLVAAQVTNQCGPWVMGKDKSGVAVVINTTTGEVRSHGSVHAGMPLSSLPEKLALPLRY